jgi:hypothetical protein
MVLARRFEMQKSPRGVAPSSLLKLKDQSLDRQRATNFDGSNSYSHT